VQFVLGYLGELLSKEELVTYGIWELLSRLEVVVDVEVLEISHQEHWRRLQELLINGLNDLT
jgi:hypothetical protein